MILQDTVIVSNRKREIVDMGKLVYMFVPLTDEELRKLGLSLDANYALRLEFRK